MRRRRARRGRRAGGGGSRRSRRSAVSTRSCISAGVIHIKPLSEVSEADWDLTLDVNLKGAFLDGAGRRGRCARAAAGASSPSPPTPASAACLAAGLHRVEVRPHRADRVARRRARRRPGDRQLRVPRRLPDDGDGPGRADWKTGTQASADEIMARRPRAGTRSGATPPRPTSPTPCCSSSPSRRRS